MANTRQSAKRARQTITRTVKNINNKSATKTVVKAAVEAITKLDVTAAKAAYLNAVKALSKAASKGAIPKGRAARKISRLTQLAKKTKPEVVAAQTK